MPDKPSPLVDNPSGDDFRTLKDDGRRFRVEHNAVGAHKQNAVISARELGPGAELPRLLKLGAISELSASEIEALEDAATAPESAPGPVVQPTGTGPVVKPSDLAKPAEPAKPKA